MNIDTAKDDKKMGIKKLPRLLSGQFLKTKTMKTLIFILYYSENVKSTFLFFYKDS